MLTAMRYFVLILTLYCGVCLLPLKPFEASADPPAQASELTKQRHQLDQTVWSNEVEALRYEKRIVQLWDELRSAKGGADSLKVLADFPVKEMVIGQPASSTSLELGIRRIQFASVDAKDSSSLDKARSYDSDQWAKLVSSLGEQDFELVESEWHHSAFTPGENPQSVIDFVLHVAQPPSKSRPANARLIVKGKLRITWQSATPDRAEAKRVVVSELNVLTRVGGPVFRKAFECRRRDNDVASAHPIIVHDLDQNGLPELIISRWNRVYWNEGKGRFVEQPLFDKPVRVAEVGLVADVNRDGRSDFLTVNKTGQLTLFRGSATGPPKSASYRKHFPSAQEVVADVSLAAASVITAGDVDQDGDLDVFVAQYKPAYQQGQMPTPYYDANDGEPAYLLLNDGTGKFVDATESKGLTSHRRRRTYSASFVDFDGDRDLDLVRVSDYAGVDLDANDGSGSFSDATKRLGANRHLFGMAHTFGDYNLDGELDLYAIGMSSTTARRLDDMQLGRDDRADIHKMRSAMGFGNRMYLGNGKGVFTTPKFSADVARTGWSWGTTAFDYDLDGDEDIYVANGFRSGDSCEDYCSTFWRHDIYCGSSKQDPQLESLFAKSMLKLNKRSMSWNGYEHNALLHNLDGEHFTNIAFLMGVGCEFDSRSVIGTDLDGDGRPDLIVSDYEFAGRGFISSIHVYRNTLPTKNNWIGLRIYDGGIASGLQGATAELVSDGRTQIRQLVTGDSFASQHDNVFHFGLCKSKNVERLTIRLQNGEEKVLSNPAINKYHGLTAE